MKGTMALFVPMQVTARPVEAPPPTKGLTAPATKGAPPAAVAPTLEPGIHVSWALPDAFMRGRADEDGVFHFPDVPDMWVISRSADLADNTSSPPYRQQRYFVLNSWTGAVTPLASYLPVSISKPDQRLTAIGLVDLEGELISPDPLRPSAPGTPDGPESFVAYYPTARRRFGFHDTLEGVAGGPVSYMVVGWFQDLARDPLNAAGTDGARYQKMKALGWRVQGGFSTVPGSVDPGTAASACGQDAAADHTLPVPDHVLVHGMIVDVPWKGKGGRYVTQEGTDPSATAEITVGDSLADAMSSLLTPETELRWLLEILQGRGLRDLKDIDGLARIQEVLHEAGFFAGREMTLEAAAAALATDPLWGPLAAQALADTMREEMPANPSGGTWKEPKGKVKGSTEVSERWWRPNPPILMIGNAGRSFFYGHDGRMDTRGDVLCRVEVQHILYLDLGCKLMLPSGKIALEGLVRPDQVGTVYSEKQFFTPGIWRLLAEFILLDPCNAARVATFVVNTQPRQLAPTDRTAAIPLMEEQFRLEATALWLSRLPGAQHTDVARLSRYRSGRGPVATSQHTCHIPSGLAVAPYTGGWTTLYIEYQGIFLPTDGALSAGWALGAADHTVTATATWGLNGVSALPVNTARGVAVDAGPRTLADGLRRLAKDPLIRQEMSAEAAANLEAQAAWIGDLNVISCDLSALDAALVASGRGLHCRAGAFAFTSVKLIDIYGRVANLNVNNLRAPADSLKRFTSGPLNGRTGILLPPRLLVGARAALKLRTPVCGFLMYDYMDRAVEVLDADGISQGQLRLGTHGVCWEPAPGEEATIAQGAAANIEDEDLRRMVQGILKAGLLHRTAGRRGDTDPLTALIALLDLVRGTVDRRGDTEEFLALLTGAPIAVVRAELRLDYEPTARDIVARQLDVWGRAHPALPSPYSSFPGGLKVRLGDLAQLDDGVLGYFLDDTPEILQSPVPGDVSLDLPWQQSDVLVSSVPSIRLDALLDLRPGTPAAVTLLLAPGASVSLTSGILPRRRASLSREVLKASLDRLAPTFGFGPLLVDPAALRLPLAAVERLDWEWTARTQPASGAGGWSVTQAEAADQTAVMGQGPLQLQEGWLRIKPAPGAA